MCRIVESIRSWRKAHFEPKSGLLTSPLPGGGGVCGCLWCAWSMVQVPLSLRQLGWEVVIDVDGVLARD